MRVDVVLLPSLIRDEHLVGRGVAVFDVLRATTSMAAALAAGVSEIRIYADTASAARAAGPASQERLLCGEENCLPPPGFDLGNSPGAFNADRHHGRVMHMSTTNGTRAIVASRKAAAVYPVALVNARATAVALLRDGRDVTLLCAGTGGAVAIEDVIGAGAVLDALYDERPKLTHASDEPLIARLLYRSFRDSLRIAISSGKGGENVEGAGLSADIDFAARLDVFDVVGRIDDPAAETPVVRRMTD
jgi:2-phosphosulfolactate phosphatase